MEQLQRKLRFGFAAACLSSMLILGMNCGGQDTVSKLAAACSKVKVMYKTLVYSEPRPGARSLFAVEAGTVAQVVDSGSGGYKISTSQGTGWIMQDTAMCVGDSNPPPNPPGGGGGGGGGNGGGGNGGGGSSGGAGNCQSSYPATWPVPSQRSVSQGFGVPSSYMTCGFHTGIDISSGNGTNIVAAGSGKVVHVGHMWLSAPGTGRGQYSIIIDHGGNVYSTYGHNSRANVRVGDCVRSGESIAAMGSLGYSSGPHLHFEIVKGSRFTGDWSNPFANACPHYENPNSYF